jgi:DNA-binding transcriptional MerR regulator
MALSYTIGQAAGATGLSRHTLRYYERIGLIEPVTRLPNGHRRYSEDDLWWIGFIMLVATTGMPVRRMRQFAALERRGEPASAKVALLERERDRLRHELRRLGSYLEAVERKIAFYSKVV